MYKARIEHTKETCLRLAEIQYKYYGRDVRVIRNLLGAIPLVLSMIVGLNTTIGILLIALSCIFFYSTSAMYEREADKAYSQIGYKFSKVNYLFSQEEIVIESGGKKKTNGYNEIYSLKHDDDYIYMFINSKQAYMMSIDSIEQDQIDEFYNFIETKTDKKWKIVSFKPSFITELRHSIDGMIHPKA